MDIKKIDELYDVYCTKNMVLMNNIFRSAIMKDESLGGGQTLIDNLNEYISTSVRTLPTLFESHKQQDLTDEEVEALVSGFWALAETVEALIYSKLKTYYTSKQIDQTFEGIETADLFKIDINVIKEAYQSDVDHVQDDVSEKLFNSIIRIIEFVKEKKSINKVFGKNNINEIPLHDVLITLYDFHNKNNEIFKIETDDATSFEIDDEFIAGYFNEIKIKCSKVCSRDFDKYRPSFISKKNLTEELKKIVFCKNLLEFYKTGVMVYQNGFMDKSFDNYYGEQELKKAVSYLYRKDFSYNDFKNMQSNYIFNPNSFGLNPETLISQKSIMLDNNEFAMGLVLSSEREDYYLMHVFIKDVSNLNGTFEIQLNAMPDSNIKSRVQLIRLDNWETKQSHKNIAKKLETSTHIHMYNHFDLLRGKSNGSFDIAYNVEDKNTDFLTALKLFLGVVGFEDGLDIKVYKTIEKAIKTAQAEVSSTDEV